MKDTSDLVAEIEALLARRLRTGRIEGRTLETAQEIAALLTKDAPGTITTANGITLTLEPKDA